MSHEVILESVYIVVLSTNTAIVVTSYSLSVSVSVSTGCQYPRFQLVSVTSPVKVDVTSMTRSPVRGCGGRCACVRGVSLWLASWREFPTCRIAAFYTGSVGVVVE